MWTIQNLFSTYFSQDPDPLMHIKLPMNLPAILRRDFAFGKMCLQCILLADVCIFSV